MCIFILAIFIYCFVEVHGISMQINPHSAGPNLDFTIHNDPNAPKILLTPLPYPKHAIPLLRLVQDIHQMNYSIELWSSDNVHFLAIESLIPYVSLAFRLRSDDEENALRENLKKNRDDNGLINYDDYFHEYFLSYMPIMYKEILARLNTTRPYAAVVDYRNIGAIFAFRQLKIPMIVLFSQNVDLLANRYYYMYNKENYGGDSGNNNNNNNGVSRTSMTFNSLTNFMIKISSFFHGDKVLNEIQTFAIKNKLSEIRNWKDVYKDCLFIYYGISNLIDEIDLRYNRFYITSFASKPLTNSLPKELILWLNKDPSLPVLLINLDLRFIEPDLLQVIINYYTDKYRIIFLPYPKQSFSLSKRHFTLDLAIVYRPLLYSQNNIGRIIHHCEEYDLSEIVFSRMKSVCIPIVSNQYILCKKLKSYKICESLFLNDINNESLSKLDKFLENKQKNNLRAMMTEAKFRESDSAREEFNKYLESSGVNDVITKLIVLLHDEYFHAIQEKQPVPNGVEYIKKCLGVPTTGNIEALKAKLEELEQRKAELLAKQPH